MAKLKKPKKKNNFKFLILFIATFVVALFFVSVLFRNFSPPVDVNIGGEANSEIAEENEHFAELDSRLKWIQYEDTMGESMQKSESSALGNTSSSETKKAETSVKSDKKSVKKVEKTGKKPLLAEPPVMQYSYDEIPLPVKTKTVTKPPVPTVVEVKNATAVPTAVNYSNYSNASVAMTKVYIGFYPTMEQANTIRARVSTAVAGCQPYVRRLGSQYVVQVASFSDRDKAVSLKSELDSKGFSARLLTE